MTTIYNQTELTREEKVMIEECFIVGKLADDGINLPRIGRDIGKSVSKTNFEGPDKVVFYIKPLSSEPKILREKLGKTENEVYITFDNRNRRYLEQIGYYEAEEPVDFLIDHFKNKLILFKPILTYDREKSFFHYNLEIVLDEEESNNIEKYVPIPIMRKGMTAGMFEKRLMDPKPLELNSYNHSLELPEFIVCDKYVYHIPDEHVIERYPVKDTLYICRRPEDIRRFPIPDKFQYTAKMLHKEVAFISDQRRMDWVDLVDDQGEYITKINDGSRNKPPNGGNAKQYKPKNESSKQPKVLESEWVSESQFISRLDYFAQKKQLIYYQDDLYNLHTALKTSNFTILGGMSGTGKTELALLYAEALGLKEGIDLLFIPVKPSYTEPSDLLGFFNQQTGVFVESEIGLVSFLKNASRNPDKMHMVLFDEMNLGQVEHYFSDFISLLELPSQERRLRLINRDIYTVQEGLKEGISIGSNILFVGTANFDETTKDFSNRMLDRSNVILLEKLSFSEAIKFEAKKIEDVKEYVDQEMSDLKDLEKVITTYNFNRWIKSKRGLTALTDEELRVLDKLHEEMSNFDSQTGVSFRIAKQVGHYLENIPIDEEGNYFLKRESAFDYQIKQRILTKIRGHREQIENLIGRYEDKYIEGRVGIILSSDDGPEFDKSRKYLEQKAKELMRNGYTL